MFIPFKIFDKVAESTNVMTGNHENIYVFRLLSKISVVLHLVKLIF
jgi:hypothetical protein